MSPCRGAPPWRARSPAARIVRRAPGAVHFATLSPIVVARPTPLEATSPPWTPSPNTRTASSSGSSPTTSTAWCPCTGAAEAKGRQIADARHAAFAMDAGARVATWYSAFRRFEVHGLRWRYVVPQSVVADASAPCQVGLTASLIPDLVLDAPVAACASTDSSSRGAAADPIRHAR